MKVFISMIVSVAVLFSVLAMLRRNKRRDKACYRIVEKGDALLGDDSPVSITNIRLTIAEEAGRKQLHSLTFRLDNKSGKQIEYLAISARFDSDTSIVIEIGRPVAPGETIEYSKTTGLPESGESVSLAIQELRFVKG